MNTKNNFKLKNNLPLLLTTIIFTLMIIIGLLVHFLPNFRSESYLKYFNFDKNTIQTSVDNKYIKSQTPPIIRNGNLFMSYDFVKTHVDEYIYWDDNLNKLTITTSDKVIRFTADETTYYVNSNPMTMNIPVNMINGKPYLPKTLLESLYNTTFSYVPETNMVIVQNNDEKSTTALTLKKNTVVRFEANKKSFIETKLNINSKVYVYEKGNLYTKIKTETGLIGFVLNKNLGNFKISSGIPKKQQEKIPPIEGKIILEYDQITTPDANYSSQTKVIDSGVNVLVPTWFKFNQTVLNGDIIAYADENYVNFAHKNGIQVWGLISDVGKTFDTKISHAILNNTDYREHVIKQLLAYMSLYNLDGINVDFEAIDTKDGNAYLQFFRELYPYMKAEGKILSVDMYVPSSWSKFYNRTEVAKTCDYICVMAYDEHNANSDTIGPNSSISFVENGIKDTLEEVPKNQILLGIPLYCNVWKSVISNGKVKESLYSTYGMDTTYNKFIKNGAKFTWDSTLGCFYGEYILKEKGISVTYKTWLEDKDSMTEKLNLYKQYDLQGIAAWKKGLAGNGIWKLIDSYVK